MAEAGSFAHSRTPGSNWPRPALAGLRQRQAGAGRTATCVGPRAHTGAHCCGLCPVPARGTFTAEHKQCLHTCGPPDFPTYSSVGVPEPGGGDGCSLRVMGSSQWTTVGCCVCQHEINAGLFEFMSISTLYKERSLSEILITADGYTLPDWPPIATL